MSEYSDAVEAAAKAEFMADRHTADEWDYPQNDMLREAYRKAAHAALAAALPFLERATRDKIADELREQAQNEAPNAAEALRFAADRIAAGEAQLAALVARARVAR